MKTVLKVALAVTVVAAVGYSMPPVRQRVGACVSVFREDFRASEHQIREALKIATQVETSR